MTQPPPENQPPAYQPPAIPGPAYQQQPPTWPPQSTPSTKKPRRLLLWILGALGAIVAIGVVAGITITAMGNNSAPAEAAATTTPTAVGEEVADIPTPEETTPQVTYTPTTDDFTITAKITEKECFGSAGCNVTLRPDVSYSGTLPLNPDVTWLVVYEINGVEDAPLVGNLTIEGSDVSYHEEVVSTKSSKSKITIKVTSVEQN